MFHLLWNNFSHSDRQGSKPWHNFVFFDVQQREAQRKVNVSFTWVVLYFLSSKEMTGLYVLFLLLYNEVEDAETARSR